MSGKNLYFASDWHNGFGGLDVFMADEQQMPSSVVNMGPGINSARDDYGFVYDERLQWAISSAIAPKVEATKTFGRPPKTLPPPRLTPSTNLRSASLTPTARLFLLPISIFQLRRGPQTDRRFRPNMLLPYRSGRPTAWLTSKKRDIPTPLWSSLQPEKRIHRSDAISRRLFALDL